MAELLGVPQPESDRGFERVQHRPYAGGAGCTVADEHGRRMEELRWGLSPSGRRAAKPRFQMINARAETVLERPAYRDLVQQCEAPVPRPG